MATPEELRDELDEQLEQRRPRVKLLERYYDGDHPLPEPPKRLHPSAFQEAQRAYMSMMRQGVTNWVKLVADAPAERLEVIGYRGGSDAAAARAWDRWQANDLDAFSPLVHDTALQTGQAFAMVDPTSGRVTAEHPAQMIVRYADGSRSEVVAAFKKWAVGDDVDESFLILPGSVHRWTHSGRDVTERQGPDGDTVTDTDLDFVPVTEFAANAPLRPRPYGGGRSEFASVLPIQDRINKTVFDRLGTGGGP